MSKLTYTALMSLDGFIEDPDGQFEWAMPDVELHSYINDLQLPVGGHIYGRRMYETMAVWETIEDKPGVSAVEAEFAEVWRAADKVVYSRTLAAVSTPRTRLEREFDPEAVRQMVEAADHEISIGGPGIAEHAFRAGLVDEVHLFVFPVVVGGGKAALPRGMRVDLELLEERQFHGGVMHLHHRVR